MRQVTPRVRVACQLISVGPSRQVAASADDHPAVTGPAQRHEALEHDAGVDALLEHLGHPGRVGQGHRTPGAAVRLPAQLLGLGVPAARARSRASRGAASRRRGAPRPPPG